MMCRSRVRAMVTATMVAVVVMASVTLSQVKADNPEIIVTPVEKDPRLRLAETASETVERAEEIATEAGEMIVSEIDKAFAAINEILGDMDRQREEHPDRIVRAEYALTSIRKAANELLMLARSLAERQAVYIHNVESLKMAMLAAPVTYREAAKAFRAYAAEDEKYTDIRGDYLLMAEVWESLAVQLEQRAGELEPDSIDTKETLVYVARTAVFLQRLVAHLEALPRLDSLEMHERYREQLQRYIQSFERLREQMRLLHNDICSEAISSTLRAKPAIQVPVQTTTSVIQLAANSVEPSPQAATPPRAPLSASERRKQASLTYYERRRLVSGSRGGLAIDSQRIQYH